jgi:hydrogenase maturation factor
LSYALLYNINSMIQISKEEAKERIEKLKELIEEYQIF